MTYPKAIDPTPTGGETPSTIHQWAERNRASITTTDAALAIIVVLKRLEAARLFARASSDGIPVFSGIERIIREAHRQVWAEVTHDDPAVIDAVHAIMSNRLPDA